MSDSKHTPGPWAVTGPTGTTVCATTDRGRYPVAFAEGVSLAQMDANAALIAAAPDLLAACEALYTAVAADLSPKARDEALAAGLAAIAKARGGQ